MPTPCGGRKGTRAVACTSGARQRGRRGGHHLGSRAGGDESSTQRRTRGRSRPCGLAWASPTGRARRQEAPGGMVPSACRAARGCQTRTSPRRSAGLAVALRATWRGATASHRWRSSRGSVPLKGLYLLRHDLGDKARDGGLESGACHGSLSFPSAPGATKCAAWPVCVQTAAQSGICRHSTAA